MIPVMAAFGAGIFCWGVTYFVRKLASHLQVLDDPHIEADRRLHDRPIPLLGGLGIFFTIGIGLLFFTFVHPLLIVEHIKPQFIVGILIGAFVLTVGGYFDDRYKLSLFGKLMVPTLAAIIVVLSDIGVNFVTNPFGGVFRIDQWQYPLITTSHYTYTLTLPADIFTVLWLLLLMYTTKLLDGLDGLVAGTTSIGASIIFFLSLTPVVLQFDTALFAAVVAGAFGGFLLHNWSPASIFLGESGSLLAGYFLGILAIVAGGKMATTLLIIGVPALDLVWVVLRRVVWEGRSPLVADAGHLHHRLLSLGYTQRQVVLMLYVTISFFGSMAIFMQSSHKMLALLLLFVFAMLAALLISKKQHSV